MAKWQTSIDDALLHAVDIISNPAGFPGMSFRVKNRIGSAGVVVARLSGRSGIEDRPFFDLQRFSIQQQAPFHPGSSWLSQVSNR